MSGSRRRSCVNTAANPRNFFGPGAPAPPPARASASLGAYFSQKVARVRSAKERETCARMAVGQERTTVQPCSLRGRRRQGGFRGARGKA